MLEKCSCGLPYPLLELITGRTSDSVWTPSGIILESIYLTSIFDDYTDYVQNFRILQKSDYSVIIDIVIDKEQQSEIENVIQTIKNILLSKSKNEIPSNGPFFYLHRMSKQQKKAQLTFLLAQTTMCLKPDHRIIRPWMGLSVGSSLFIQIQGYFTNYISVFTSIYKSRK